MIPPETSNTYMVLGYAVVVLILFGLIAYFANRARRLRADLQMLEELERDSQATNSQKQPAETDQEKELVR